MKREYSLDELRLMFPALDAHERGDSDAMRGVGDPIVDQIRAVMEPYFLEDPQRPLSPAAREYPSVSDGLDRAQTVALSIRERREGVERGSFQDRQLKALNRGGQPVGVVVLHCREWTYDSAYSVPQSVAVIVPIGWPREELARHIARDTWACWLCERAQSYNCESFLMVSCGAVVHVLSACRLCRGELDFPGLDWADR
ncbi:hypothetical protein CEJ39_08480 [Rhodococcus pyridinivorans]|uniref:hypothetical protein n=1 Tax=Rhodococcus pyridinivorans TaxID=103816 RepID=UPI00057209CF|nr:hypothetical protein [Rhodococcus pyridinivorans]AWZ24212.1 hypothetical protein CEJ39_08480 [Rhodococcus pyridinivorans]